MTAKEFLSNLPGKIKPDENPELNTIMHFDFNDEKYSISVENGIAKFSEGLNGDAEVTLKSSASDFAKIAAGEMNPMTAMMFGKLKVSNPPAMMKYAKMLGLM